MHNALTAENLSKRYGSVLALDSVDLTVEPGSIFGFLGPNGAGKSTFVKIMLGLVKPSGGRATLFGMKAGHPSSRSAVGFLPESMKAQEFLSVGEFMRFHAELAGLRGKNSKKEVAACLDETGMAQHSRKSIASLSKGMLQRTGIAQALLGKPRLVFLDEPTSGLDPIGIRDIRSLLLRLKKNGTTVFLNSHLLSEVERTCDRIAILNRGKIIRTGDRMGLAESGRHLEVVADTVGDECIARINRICSRDTVQSGQVLHIYLNREEDAVEVHKIIADCRCKLISLAWRGESLEELFYRLVAHETVDDN